MTIKELVAKLELYPNPMEVMIRNDKGNLEHIYEVSQVITGIHGMVIIDSTQEKLL